ncbi:uncharacterized protein PHACADRAFT_214650 [Phanerochaete carnosa HHB-10118-sp]|uniref:Uncharacterized protein n=1 Tax=Phanerochaete carnosa (strain HHB-10118-sp) TaxID=650164 RepID=K5WF84_PHACS|nr:uncharacterized protein PHACADRAFT_214650 [Phanerochaete carnosa HHB-10118-sp]EKM48802.1 hypothetical protein PHACADRAFT_214650 [Phanerochaete carnosa HHB-10118-sp]
MDPAPGARGVKPSRVRRPMPPTFPNVIKEGLRFKWGSTVGFAAFPGYVRAMGSVLTHLGISLLHEDNSYLLAKFGLEGCTHLWSSTDRSWVLQMLAQICSPHLTAVVLNLYLGKLADLLALNFNLIDTVPSETRFARTMLTLSFTPLPYPLPHGERGPDDRILEYFTYAISKMQNLYDQRLIALLPHGLSPSAAVLPYDM